MYKYITGLAVCATVAYLVFRPKKSHTLLVEIDYPAEGLEPDDAMNITVAVTNSIFERAVFRDHSLKRGDGKRAVRAAAQIIAEHQRAQ